MKLVLLWLSLYLVQSMNVDGFVPSRSSFVPTFKFTTTLFQSANDYKFEFSWALSKDDFYGMMELSQPVNNTLILKDAWVAIGFGTGMFNSEIITCHGLTNGSVSMFERRSDNRYMPPSIFYSKNTSISMPISGSMKDGKQTCIFQRKLSPQDPDYVKLSAVGLMNLIWAFNPTSSLNYKQERFTFHAPTHRGSFVAVTSGKTIPNTKTDFPIKQTHGILMMCAWLIVLPSGAFYARYFRTTINWFIVKLIVQTLGLVLAVISTVCILTTQWRIDGLHGIMGVTVLSLLLVQILFGGVSVIAFSYTPFNSFRGFSKKCHTFIGITLFTLSFVQIGIGLHKIYPWEEKRDGSMFWGFYFGAIIFWIVATFMAELLWGNSLHKKERETLFDEEQAIKSVTNDGMKNYTWESLHQAVMDGKLLVVTKGRWVYDLSTWYQSHPGGRRILQMVSGTDVTFELVNQYSDTLIHLKIEPPQKTYQSDTKLLKKISLSDIRNEPIDDPLDFDSSPISLLTENDLAILKQSRVKHAHSRFAIQKLSQFLVGEIPAENNTFRPSVNSSNTINNENLPFENYEFRRYVITKKEIQSTSSFQKQIILFKFCMVYPSIKQNQPVNFIPGQSVQIQVCKDGKYISRYYTPIKGDLISFEILVKIEPDGIMSQYLLQQNCGANQIKIRGPFGSSILPKSFHDKAIPFQFPERIYFFAGGSGITLFIQLTNYILYNTKLPRRVIRFLILTVTGHSKISTHW
ncbi:hypothetical protein BC833DRAFT_577159 [Globomyces pollinis-pini]|nr:hypothetical protein BC833DRAFT_577159 [Globomyces pollinis-pini]